MNQVQMTHAVSPSTRSFIYRNFVKALPWYTLVRTKITDPAYASWFMSFGPPTVGNGWHVPLCTNLYHDQGQTPGYPHGDGDCDPPGCDVGSVPVGEYLFDFRAVNVSVNGQTFISWYIDEYFFGPTGAGSPLVGGFYVDDFWSSAGANEMDGNHIKDMGLSVADVADLTAAFMWASALVYAETLKRGKFIWDQMLTHDPYAPLNGDCPQPWVKQASCAADLRGLCTSTAEPQTRTLLYGFSPGSCTGTDPNHLAMVDQDVANFLLVRGPYAYLGLGWLGCGGTAEYPAKQFNADYGDALGICSETAPGSGVFTREFTKSTVQMDCATWTPTITFK